jgi:hypothetical protein
VTVPRGVRACLWSYDPRRLDRRRDRRVVITQVLNHGGWKDVLWLLKTYRKSDIRDVLRRPSRGMWLPDVLNFWVKIWSVRIPKRLYRQALFSIHPQPIGS